MGQSARVANAGPLAGIRVLDLCTVGPGARAAALLADLGADVIKVGPPAAANRIVAADWAYSAARGTRRIGIDLKDPRGREAFLALVQRADVVLEGFRPGVSARLGIGFEDVSNINGKIVYASLTGYGQDGPYAQWAGHDVNYQAVGGVLGLQGLDGNGTPSLPGATWADSAGGGFHAVMSICAALVGDPATRQATHLDVSATDGVVSAMSLALDEHLATGVEHQPGSSILTGRYACYGVYACADGKHVAVGAIEAVFWRNLCRLLELGHLADLQRDDKQQDQVRSALAAKFASGDRDDWVKLLGPADTCVSPVLAPHEVVVDKHLVARGSVASVQSGGAPSRQISRMLAGAVRPGQETGTAVAMTQPRELLREAGFDDPTIDTLLDQEVVQ
jgi:alpha-methylacyl-CoA racemase